MLCSIFVKYPLKGVYPLMLFPSGNAYDDPYPVNNFTGVISLLKTYMSTIYTAPVIKSNSLLVVYRSLSLVAAGGYGKIESLRRACYVCEDD